MRSTHLRALIGLSSLLAAGCGELDFGPDERPPAAPACLVGDCPLGEVCVRGLCVAASETTPRDSGAIDARIDDDAAPPADGGADATELPCSTVFVDVSVGDSNACAISEAGAVWCWGWNQCGQLYGLEEDLATAPIRIDTAPLVRLAEHFDDHICGLDTQGHLYCWGCGYSGTLADFSGPPSVRFDDQRYVDAQTSWVGTCTVRDDGVLTCFGGDHNGQLACAPPDAVDPICEPTEIASPTAFTRVSFHQRHGCGISAGQLYCWGTNDVGQLGRGSLSGSEPLPPGPVASPLGAAVDVTAGINHTCAIETDGDLYCWGNNVDGQLGIGGFSRESAPVRVGPGYGRVRAGTSHTCAIDTSGALFCWGRNTSGRLGLGDQMERDAPARVDDAERYVAVATGGSSTCGVREGGRVYCWGSNEHGKLGVGRSDVALAETPTPTPIACR